MVEKSQQWEHEAIDFIVSTLKKQRINTYTVLSSFSVGTAQDSLPGKWSHPELINMLKIIPTGIVQDLSSKWFSYLTS